MWMKFRMAEALLPSILWCPGYVTTFCLAWHRNWELVNRVEQQISAGDITTMTILSTIAPNHHGRTEKKPQKKKRFSFGFISCHT
ncbi:hypothetical protein B0T09DRAFT_173546 [Sordaria sp. MPI-SDFR-AT-0083]|nr:hypothetical protein B0T09DRAFT_173546 [Sordaria sp. MPI-SDFR-AT-0083]